MYVPYIHKYNNDIVGSFRNFDLQQETIVIKNIESLKHHQQWCMSFGYFDKRINNEAIRQCSFLFRYYHSESSVLLRGEEYPQKRFGGK